MKKRNWFLLVAIGIALATMFLSAQRAVAQDDDDANDDPPTRVARLAYVGGSVGFQPAGTDDWVDAVVNRPLTTGDKLWAGDDSRAELTIGSASLRISNQTGFSFLNLSDETTQVQLTQGTLRIRVKRLEEDETFEVDTPNLAFDILRPGVYRIDVSDDGNTTMIRVSNGGGEVTGEGSAYTLHRHEIGIFTGTDELQSDIEPDDQYQHDDFDTWCADRDRRQDLSVSARYVAPDVIGYEDLDGNGGWRDVPEYGMVWFPHTTIVGWAPYRYGHWAYIAPWGYTWVDDEPWGFAPFHYGRWVNVDGWWGWVPAPPPTPGRVYIRPVYAPALVAWVGGAHFGIGISVGEAPSVGWFPLGPREVYVPSYHVSRTYVNNVNVTNTTVNTTVVNNYYNNVVVNKTVVNNNTTVVNNVTNVTYVNERVAGAVTATSQQAFTSAQPVAKNIVAVNQKEIVRAPVNVFTPPVAPEKRAVLGSGTANVVRPPAAVENRTVVAKVVPPPPRVPFEKQQAEIKANGGRPVALTQIRQTQPPVVPTQNSRGVVRVATTTPANNARPNNVPQNNNQGRNGQFNQNANNNQNHPVVNNQPENNNRPGNNNNQNNNNQGRNGQFHPFPNNNQNRPVVNNEQPGNVQNNQGRNQQFNPPPNNDHQGNNQGITNRTQPNFNNAPANNAQKNAEMQLDQQHQQQREQLQQQQDAERQKLEQQQNQERQRIAQQQADQQRQQQLQQQLNQQHQQQLEQQRQAQIQQQNQLRQQQQQEWQRQQQMQRQQQQQRQQPVQQQQRQQAPQVQQRQQTPPPPNKDQHKEEHK